MERFHRVNPAQPTAPLPPASGATFASRAPRAAGSSVRATYPSRTGRARTALQVGGTVLLVALGGALWLLLSAYQRLALEHGSGRDAAPPWAWLVWGAYILLVVVFHAVAWDRDDLAPPSSRMAERSVADRADVPRSTPSPAVTGSAARNRPARVVPIRKASR